MRALNDYFSTKQLAVGYDGVPLIRDIEIRLQKGHILTLIGPNGSGKSTILKTAANYLKTIAGTVYVDGRALQSFSSHELSRRLSVVLTQRLKTELMTCREVVETGRYPYTGRLGILAAEDRCQVLEAMETVNVRDLAERYFNTVSDGQKQRVLLARALCQQPEIMVLDEPTSYLDIRYELELLSALRNMARERHIAVMMSLHELDLAERVSDEVLCVSGDTISHYGKTDEIFNKELIENLYGVTSGSYQPLFGSLEMQRPQGVPKTFIIAGGGTGIPAYRGLQKRQIPYATGILHENDVDYQVARALAGCVVAEKSFQRITADTYARALEKLKHCDTLLNCLTDYGEMNRENQRLAAAAAQLGLRVVKNYHEVWETI